MRLAPRYIARHHWSSAQAQHKLWSPTPQRHLRARRFQFQQQSHWSCMFARPGGLKGSIWFPCQMSQCKVLSRMTGLRLVAVATGPMLQAIMLLISGKCLGFVWKLPEYAPKHREKTAHTHTHAHDSDWGEWLDLRNHWGSSLLRKVILSGAVLWPGVMWTLRLTDVPPLEKTEGSRAFRMLSTQAEPFCTLGGRWQAHFCVEFDTLIYSFKILHIVSWCRKYPQRLQHFCAWRSWPSSLADTCEADMFKFFLWLSVLCVGSAAVVVCSYRKRVPLCARDWSRSKVKNFNMQDQSIVWKGCCLATNEICQGIRWQFLAWHYSIGCT